MRICASAAGVSGFVLEGSGRKNGPPMMLMIPPGWAQAATGHPGPRLMVMMLPAPVLWVHTLMHPDAHESDLGEEMGLKL